MSDASRLDDHVFPFLQLHLSTVPDCQAGAAQPPGAHPGFERTTYETSARGDYAKDVAVNSVMGDIYAAMGWAHWCLNAGNVAPKPGDFAAVRVQAHK